MADVEFSDEDQEVRFDEDRGLRSDEAEEESTAPKDEEDDRNEKTAGRRIDPSTSKRVTRNPQPKLNAERIQGPKGIQTIENYFEGFKFHGKGREKEDLDRVMKRMEHWAHRLFPKYDFDDFIEKMEVLGTKKNIQVFIKKYRLGMIETDVDTTEATATNDEERGNEPVPEDFPMTEFDKLIAEQIEKQKQVESTRVNQTNIEPSNNNTGNVLGSANTMKTTELSDEIKARIERNRKIALERKMAREKRMELENNNNLEESIIESVPQYSATESQSVEEVSAQLEKPKNSIEPASKDFGSSNLETNVENIEHLEENCREEEISNEQPRSVEKIPESAELSSRIEETMEISTIEKMVEALPNETEQINSSQIEDRSILDLEGASERLFTRDELLMEIDGALEEIIKRNERRSAINNSDEF